MLVVPPERRALVVVDELVDGVEVHLRLDEAVLSVAVIDLDQLVRPALPAAQKNKRRPLNVLSRDTSALLLS